MCHTSFQWKGLAWNAQPHLCHALHPELWELSWQRQSEGTGQAVWLWDRDTIAGLQVPPSGGQKMLKGHPSLRPGCCGAQQTCPRQASLSCPHPARPTCLQQLSQNHAGSAGPASLPPTLVHSGGCIKQLHGRDRGIYSRCNLLITSSAVLSSPWVSLQQCEHRNTCSALHSACS